MCVEGVSPFERSFELVRGFAWQDVNFTDARVGAEDFKSVQPGADRGRIAK